MSDIMLHGVLQMPPELWSDSPIDVAQRHARYLEASARIEADEKKIEELIAAINSLCGAKGRYHTELAYHALVALKERL